MIHATLEIDQYWLKASINLAKQASSFDEVPVGAVVVLDNKIIGSGFNQPIRSNDPTAHAEIVALREAASALQNYRLIDTTLYVTLEPCAMCIGAMIHARIKRLVFGASDSKTGAVNSVLNLLDNNLFNHKIEYSGGILQDECGVLLTEFFKKRR